MNTSDYKQLFEQSSELVVVMDTEFTILAASDSYLKVTKTTRENITGRDIFHVFPDNPNDIAANGESKIRDSFNRVLKNKTADTLAVVKYDIPKPESEGGGFELKYWRPCHSPVLDEFNNVKYIIQRVEDVTENEGLVSKLELEKKTLKGIEDSEKRYKLMLMKSPFGFAAFKGKSMVITLANDSIKEFWGKGKDVEGKTLLQVLPELKDQPFPAMIDSVFTTGIPVYANEILARLLNNGKMEDKYFNVVYQPHHEADDTISGVTTIAHEVTEMVLARKKVEESEQRYLTLIEEAYVATALYLGPEIRVQYANDIMVGYWGKDKAVLGKPLIEAVPELTGQPFLSYLEAVYTSGKPYTGVEEKADLLINGKLQSFYFNFTCKALRDKGGNIYGIHHMAIDVTSEVLIKKALEASENRYKSLTKATTSVVWIADSKGYFLEPQPSWQEYTGQPWEEHQGFGWTNMIQKDDRQKIIQLWQKALEQKSDFHASGRIWSKKHNAYRYFESTGIPFLDEQENIKEWVGMITDVHEQRTADEKIEESEKQFRLLTNAMPQKISTADAVGNVTFYNQQWIEDTGYTLEELKGWGWEKVMHPEDMERTKKSWQQSVATGNLFDVECRILNTKGEFKWHLSRALPVKDEGGKIKMWVGSNTDIHLQKEQKEELEKAVVSRTRQLVQKNAELENANKELTSFTYVSSHDLQEPLRKLQNFASFIMLEEEKNLSETGKGYFLRMRQIAQRMQELIEDLLEYSRAKSGERRIENIDLNLLWNEVKADFEEVIHEKKAILDAIALCHVKIMPLPFRQVFQNLVSNAFKFSRPDVPPHLIIKSEIAMGRGLNKKSLKNRKEKLLPQIKYCHITFSDNGIGFDPQYKDRIFEVFQRLHTFEEYGGTGIGLAICKRIIENHNGFITATGKLGQGAQFDIYIPAN